MAVSPNVVLFVLTWPLAGSDSALQSTTVERSDALSNRQTFPCWSAKPERAVFSYESTELCLLLYICSAQSENLRNLEIAMRILRILRLRSNLEIVQPISRLCDLHAESTNFQLYQYA